MSKVEEVAKAIYEKRNGKGCTPWAKRGMAHKAPYFSDARAAIEAMRVPTPSMVKTGVDFALQASVSGRDGWQNYISAKHRAMIDAALSEEVAG